MSDSPSSPAPPEPCPNCGVTVELQFCPACGQRRGDYRKALSRLVGDFLRETLELDGRLGRTLRSLVRPGQLTREFNEGRRARYVSPVRLYLFVSVLLFAAAGLSLRLQLSLDPPPEQETTEVDDSASIEIDGGGAFQEALRKRAAELERMSPADRKEELLTGALGQGPLVMFVLLPVFALLLKIVFLGTGRLYVEHLVFALHLHSAWFLLALPAVIVPVGWMAPTLLLIPVYTAFALRHAYDAGWAATLLRSAVLAFGYGFVLLLGLASAVVLGMLLS